MMMFVKNVRLQIAITLLIVTFLTFIHYFYSIRLLLGLNYSTFRLPLDWILTIITAQITGIVFLKLAHKKIFFSLSAFITASLIFLILSPTSTLITYICAAAIAIASKYIIYINGKHILNPAAFGIMASSLLFNTYASWWGVSWPLIIPLIIILGSFPVLRRMRRLWIAGGFIIVNFIVGFIITPRLTVDSFLNGTLILFTFIMLPEPQTSPTTHYWIKLFGVFVVVLAILVQQSIGLIHLSLDPYITALLLADCISFVFIKLNLPSRLSLAKQNG